jgi:hypothetical protein
MSRLSALLIVCATLSATTGLAHAGACAQQITQLRQAAQLDHEPTPESVGQAQTYAQLSFAAELAQAEAQDALRMIELAASGGLEVLRRSDANPAAVLCVTVAKAQASAA